VKVILLLMKGARQEHEHQKKKPKSVPVTQGSSIQNGVTSLPSETDEEKKLREKRALCWSVVALGMSIPALIGA